jgi:DNA polymerase III delta subunit
MIQIVHGQDELGASERARQIVAEIDPSGFSTSVVTLAESSLLDIQSALQAAPFFGGTRVVILRGPATSRKRSAEADMDDGSEPTDRLRPANVRGCDWSELIELLGTCPSTTHALAWVHGALPSNHTLLKRAREFGWSVEAFRIPRGAELMAWIGLRAEKAGVRMTPDAVQALLDLLYPTVWRAETRWDSTTIDLQLVATEIEKLACASSDGTIDVSIVDELVADRSGYTAFRLNDSIFGGDPRQALKELDDVLEAGEPAERIVAQLSAQLVTSTHASLVGEFPPEQVAAALGASAGSVGTARSKRGALSRRSLGAAAETLRSYDYAVKSGRSRDSTAIVVPLTAELASHFSRKPGERADR